MSKFAGFLVLAGGLGLATYSLNTAESPQTTLDVTRILTQPVVSPEPSPHLVQAPREALRTFSPSEPLIADNKPMVVRPATIVTRGGDQRVADAKSSVPVSAVGGFVTTVEAAPTASDRGTIARKLQLELKRVGCYDGDVTGTWDSASREAMRRFTARVNAKLPVDDPDFILLTLVQGHGAGACSRERNRTVVASAPSLSSTPLAVPAPVPVTRTPLPGRMTVGATGNPTTSLLPRAPQAPQALVQAPQGTAAAEATRRTEQGEAALAEERARIAAARQADAERAVRADNARHEALAEGRREAAVEARREAARRSNAAREARFRPTYNVGRSSGGGDYAAPRRRNWAQTYFQNMSTSSR